MLTTIQSKPKTYRINEIHYTLTGEGVRAGCPSVFVRMSEGGISKVVLSNPQRHDKE